MRDLVKGDIPTLILAVLSEGPSHGYAIGRRIEKESEEMLKMREGALYPALRTFEQDGLVIGEWESPPNSPSRKVYTLTAAGRAELTRRRLAWRHYVSTINRLIGEDPHAEPA